MNEISVEYEVLVSVKVDLDTGKVTRVVAHTEEFNTVIPLRVYSDEDGYLADHHQDPAGYASEAAKTAEAVASMVIAEEVEVPWKASPFVVVKIDNDYSDGHHAETFHRILQPETFTDTYLDTWFEENVWPLTGTGRDGDACYTATITASSDARFVGKTHEWC